ncbi:unnamed protein product [Danaus chrysippus]|uniref:(African queen) hypothetical protein n=2 Tax=Danaus TaxID=13036 RepID=A0A8J2R2V4_9NEOP|nr:unnamed protein product [Danaus chrysippus]
MAQNSDAVLLQWVEETPAKPPPATEKSTRKIRSPIPLILSNSFCILDSLCVGEILVVRQSSTIPELPRPSQPHSTMPCVGGSYKYIGSTFLARLPAETASNTVI